MGHRREPEEFLEAGHILYISLALWNLELSNVWDNTSLCLNIATTWLQYVSMQHLATSQLSMEQIQN